MYSAWTKHLKDPEEREKYEKSLRNSKWILEHLQEILLQMEESLENTEISPKAYSQPNWSHRQAHSNGFKQCLRTIKRLINLDLKEQQ